MSTPALPSFTKKWHSTAYEALDTSLPSLSAAGKNIVITGGGSGIGAATALRFAQAGASSISILGRRADVLESTRSVIESSVPSAKVLTYSVDVMQKPSVDAAFTAIHAAVGKIHVFVNNAGYLPAKSSILEAETEDWWLAFQINILGAFHATQAFLKFKAAESTLVNVSSAISYVLFVEGTSSYGASKEAGVRFFASVQVENPEVRVVNIQPGTVHTDMAQKSGYPSSDDVTLPASVITWLASPDAAFLKGKYIWANWDVEEMKARAEEISSTDLLTMTLSGWPFGGKN